MISTLISLCTFEDAFLGSTVRETDASIERLKKIRAHRGIRFRGQHTKTTGRRGKTVGVSKKKGF